MAKCYHCGQTNSQLSKDVTYYDGSKIDICLSCWKYVRYCDHCDYPVFKNEGIIDARDEFICPECAKNYFKCTQCKTFTSIDKKQTHNGQYYCPNCFEK